MIKFVKCESDNCKQCCLASGENNICTKITAPCAPWSRADGKNGHFIRVKYAPRPSKHERLLKALLSCMVVIRPKAANSYLKVDSFGIRLKPDIEYALISIKERMEKGVRV